ncbi:BTAD domain-containing putative transcriptional regulator [Dactylosporangium sp. NPDC049742]|uniref:AfsR/SARP family transcriptional regulator n=1 Tax=Dactylosporangium sp. NPDC049742 TaxID=3154737 RepID=UPI00341736BF
MELRVLGPMEVVHEGRRWTISSTRSGTVLACLAVNSGLVVPVADLIEAVWPEPPPTARSQIQICVSQLRRTLAEAGRASAVITRTGGYQLRMAPEEIDAHRFGQFVDEGRRLAREGFTEEALEQLRAAEAMWFGPALPGIPGEPAEAWRRQLEEARDTAVEERIRLELATGRHEELLSELERLAVVHPLRERIHAHLMLALYRCDRQAEALQVYRRARQLLVERLGADPGPELQRLERAILTQDPALDLPPTAGPVAALRTPAGAPGPPRQLPMDVADFTGREKLVEEIQAALTARRDDPQQPGSSPVVAISGPGGVGKTSVAVHAAHGLADQFPDGQLYANLGGRPGWERVPEVLAQFLRALGTSGPAIPESVSERVAQFRSLLAGRRVLVLLDNAADETQVLPLLVNAAGSAAIVTSRVRLTALPGSHQFDVQVLSGRQSASLLYSIVGPRVLAEPDEADELAALCGHLPLALRIAGARLASRPHWRVERLVSRLRDEAQLLDELVHRDLCVRGTLRLSYDSLPPETRRLLRRLSVLPGDDFPAWIAMPLLEAGHDVVEDSLERLVDVRLLEAHADETTGAVRYRFHDLVRAFARELLATEEPDGVRDELVRRVVAGWLTAAELAHRREYGGDYTIVHGTAPRWPLPDPVTGPMLARPMEWLELERLNLVAAVRLAGDAGLTEHCWDLAFTLVTLFETRAYYDEWAETAGIALHAARRAGDRRGEAVTLHSLGTMHMFLRNPDRAEPKLRQALRLLDSVDDPHAAALVRRNLAYLDRLRGDATAALDGYRAALTALRRAGDLVAEAHVLSNLARVRLSQGAPDEARELVEEALSICRSVGVRRVEAQVLHRVGEVYLDTGDLGRAAQAFEQVLHLVRSAADRTGEAHALHGLGTVHARAGRIARARATLQRAVQVAQRVAEPVVEGQALYELARLPDREPGEASAQLAAALEIFDQLGARGWHARAAQALRDLHEDAP